MAQTPAPVPPAEYKPPPGATWRTADELGKLAEYVRANNKNRSGVLNENRCDYFKGDRLIRCLLPTPVPENETPKQASEREKKDKKRPKLVQAITTKEQATVVAQALLEDQNYFIKVMVVKDPSQRGQPQKEVRVVKNQMPWEELGYYVWVYDGNPMWSNVLTGGLVVGFLLVTCFPIWPEFLKLALWYVSVTLLIVMFVTLMLRLFLFLFVWIFGWEFWIFPNLFDESLTIVDSFKPVVSFEPTKPGQMWWRMAVFAAFGSFVFWAYTQPSEFDDFLQANKQFVDDLYEGNLLADFSQQQMDDIDKLRVPTIDELLGDLAEDDSQEDVTFGEEAPREENMQFHTEEAADEDAEPDLDSLLDNLFEEDEAEELLEDMMDEAAEGS